MFGFIKNILIVAFAISWLFSCGNSKQAVFSSDVENIKVEDFSKIIDDKKVSLFTLVGENGIGMKVTNYGARIVALCVPDFNNRPVDVVLGYNTLDEYLNNKEIFMGAAIGRYANRIAGASFKIDTSIINLTKNEGDNQLHGGSKGFYNVVWDVKQESESKIIFNYLSKDGEEGFPGNLEVKMIYELTPDNELKISYKATTDKTTVCNLTHHSYFNLSGEGTETIKDHVLMIKSNAYTPVDSVSIPTGKIADVANTPFDFNQPTAIGSRLNDVDEQLKLGSGYDHNWVLNKSKKGKELICFVYSPVTRIKMDVFTDQPGMQFYSGNFIDKSLKGKSGKMYKRRNAFCLETQHFPNSPNRSDFPSVKIEPGETYTQICTYRFSIKNK